MTVPPALPDLEGQTRHHVMHLGATRTQLYHKVSAFLNEPEGVPERSGPTR
jgi:hypothetical protein